MTNDQEDFDPLRLIEDSIQSGFDPSVAKEIDERDLNWCPNVVSWFCDPAYLDIQTLYPAQLQTALRLFGDVCPWCSDYEFYLNDFEVTMSIPNILDRLTILNNGKCPKCKKTRLDQYAEGLWHFPNEFDLLWGMRCINLESFVFSARGLLRLRDVQVGDTLTHGQVSKTFDSGTLPSLEAHTDYGWTLVGARDSHIVPVLNTSLELEHKLLKDCRAGEFLLLQSPDLWPERSVAQVTPEMARLTGYLVAHGCDAHEGRLDRWLKEAPEKVDWGTRPNEIPEFILRAPKAIVCEFLAGLFGGQGYVERSWFKTRLRYRTESSVLFEQLRLLLLNLGIVTRCRTVRGQYELSTTNQDFLAIFRDHVRLTPRKQTKLLNRVKADRRTTYETPVGRFKLSARDRWPDSLKVLAAKGYFPVKITDVRAGPALPMGDLHVPGTNVYTADGFVHHNSGKSAEVGMIASYHLHRVLQIPSPSIYYKLLKNSLLVIRFVALTQKQAEESIWHQFVRSVDSCAWFSQYHDFLGHFEKKQGVELKKWLNTYFYYPAKAISGYFRGAEIDSSRGRTALASYMDEIGWWTGGENAKKANPHETYIAYEKASQTIRNAAMTRFRAGDYDVPTAIMGIVSSTMSKTDYIMRLVKLAKRDKRKVASHKASWEVNPEFALNPDELKSQREANYKVYLRDWGSVPPFANNPFIEDGPQIQKAVTLPRPAWNVTSEKGEIGLYLDATKIEVNRTVPLCLAIDLAKSHCGFAAALLQLREDDFSVCQPVGLFSLYPRGGEVIDLSATYDQFILPLCQRLNVRLVLYDQWQSKTQIDALKHEGIAAESYSLVWADFERYRTQLLQGKLEMNEPEMQLSEVDNSPDTLEDVLYPRPYTHFLWQLFSVSEIGHKVTKGDGHDDLFRVVVLASRFLWHEDYRPQFEYRGGTALWSRGTNKGRLVIAASSRSTGQPYNTAMAALSTGATVVGGRNNRALGAVVPRTKR